MGQLRSAGRALLLQATSPGEVLSALDRFAALLPGAACTTAFCGILSPDEGTLLYSSAGHPPAILTLPTGRSELLTEGRGAPLGLRRPTARVEATTEMPARAVLLLYTDGLVERRRRPLDTGINLAAGTVQAHRLKPVEQLADELMNWMTSDDGGADDVALLLYRHPAPLALTFDADPGELAPTRTALRRWLGRAGASTQVAQNVLIAVGEACANAIEHGHRHTPGRVQLVVQTVGEQIHVTVADTGEWLAGQARKNTYRGHGLNLMRALMHQVNQRTDATGTTVEMSTGITP
jgi:anti-sigma regulatory factor (Ser/Thr protein kinase)